MFANSVVVVVLKSVERWVWSFLKFYWTLDNAGKLANATDKYSDFAIGAIEDAEKTLALDAAPPAQVVRPTKAGRASVVADYIKSPLAIPLPGKSIKSSYTDKLSLKRPILDFGKAIVLFKWLVFFICDVIELILWVMLLCIVDELICLDTFVIYPIFIFNLFI